MDGTHVSGPLVEVPDQVELLGLRAAQVFLHNPMSYQRRKPPTSREIEAIRALTDVGFPMIAHSSYVSVITNPINDHRTVNSIRSITEQLNSAAILGLQSLVLHPGRIRDYEDVHRGAETIRQLAPVIASSGVQLLLENAASGLHSDVAVLKDMIDLAGSPGVGICLDTAHSYGAGYDLTLPEQQEFYLPPEILTLVKAVHFNNSIAPMNSHRDRHGSLVQGELSREELQAMHQLLREKLPEAPFIVEATQDPDEIESMVLWTQRVIGV